MTGRDLERDLVDLGDHLAVPQAEGLEARIAARLDARPARWSRRRRRRFVAVLAVAGIAVATLTPAVADWLGPRGVEVRQDRAPVAPRAGNDLDLGRAVTLREAADLAGFDPLVPRRLGAPDSVWVDARPGVPLVTLVWSSPTVLLTQFRGGRTSELMMTKFVGDGATVEEQAVGGASGLWVEGVHEVAAVAPNRELVVDRLRLSDNALLWERGPLTMRLETPLGRAEAVRIAESVV